MIAVSVAPDVARAVTAGVLSVDGVTVLARDASLDGPIAAAEARLRAGTERSVETAAVRAMYRQFGIDPTKTRPSSEALLRRIRKGDALPRINTVVDIGNWCSVETQLPFGLYDLDATEGRLALRRGRDGEEYQGIRKEAVHVAGRITLADERGPFGNPTSDSARTMVTEATRRVLVVIYGPRDLGAAPVAAALDLTAARLRDHAGGHEIERLVLS